MSNDTSNLCNGMYLYDFNFRITYTWEWLVATSLDDGEEIHRDENLMTKKVHKVWKKSEVPSSHWPVPSNGTY